MAFENEEHSNRLIIINVAKNLFANISSVNQTSYQSVPLTEIPSDDKFYIKPDIECISESSTVYNMPFLLDSYGNPWNEANAYLCHLIEYKHVMQRPTDDVRRKAARILAFKVFCEKKGIDWLDLSGRRPSSRPTYRYFFYLSQTLKLKARVVNSYTSDVYHFYAYLEKNWTEHAIDIDRVDSVEIVKIFFEHANGTGSKEMTVRALTKPVPKRTSDSIGYVRDQGELLRPLNVEQWLCLKKLINSSLFANFERLLVLIPAMTGARKQSVLTLKVRHIKKMVCSTVGNDGFYKLFIGPGTGVDTKFGKHQHLYLSPNLVHEINNYINSESAIKKRLKFKSKYKEEYPKLPEINEEDMYVFISEQGNCYYMSKDDPRYPIVKSIPTGQVVDHLKRKIIKHSNLDFPSDFYYHWLRSTFAYLVWVSLEKLVKEGKLEESSVISIIQNRLHHESRETTENYLKLFLNIDIRLDIQEAYEDFLLGSLVN